VRWLVLVAAIGLLITVGGAKAIPVATPRPVSWPQAQRLLQHCRVKALEQTHSRLVTLKLRNGGTVFAHEPRIDDIFRILNRLPRTCRPTTVATE
jgi:hypothetical protein